MMTLSTHSLTRRDLILLLIILFIAGFMRFGQSGIVEFFHDDAMLASLAQDMVSGRNIPLTGINSSVGIPNPPISVYTMALPFAVDSDPMTAIYFVMALNVIGVGLLWLLAHRYFGRTVALVAGLTYALNPWAILFSRKIWAQDFHTPFLLLGILLGLYGFCEPTAEKTTRRHTLAQILCLPVILFALQIHFAAWALLPLYLIMLWMGRERLDWRSLAVSAGLAIIVMLPYLIGFIQTARQNPDQSNPAAVSTLADSERIVSTQSLEYLAYLATGFGMETWVAPQQQPEMLSQVPPVSLWWIIGGLLCLGVGLLYRESVRPFALLLIVWAFLPAVLLIPQWAGVYPHYFIASIPALALLIGIGTTWVAQTVPLQPAGRSIILVAFCAILLTQGIYWRGLLRYVDTTPIEYPGFTTPIHYLHTVEDSLSAYDDVVVLSNGMAWDLHHESVVWSVMLSDTAQCVRTLIGDGYAVFPDSEFAVLETPSMPADAVNGLYVADNSQSFPTRSDDQIYTVHHWDNAPASTAITEDITAISPATFDIGVTLTGYAQTDARTILEWQLPQTAPGRDYQYSVHYLDSDGNRIAQQDRRFWHGRHWCQNDRLLTWFDAEIPPGTVALNVFMYRLGNANEAPFINANVLDEAGNPRGQHVRIDLPTR